MSIEVQEGQTDRVLRRSQRHRQRETDTESSSTEVESDTEVRDSWNLDGVTTNNRTIIESEESVPGESEYSFGEFSNTAHFDHKFEDRPKTSALSFRGVIEKEKETMSKEAKAGSVDSGIGRTQEAGLPEFMNLYISDQVKKDEQREQDRRDDRIRREEERREEREHREREREEAKAREERMWASMTRAGRRCGEFPCCVRNSSRYCEHR